MAAFTNQGIRFHKATESPGKRPFYLFFKVKGRKHQLCDLYRFKNGGIIPAECNFGKTHDGRQKLPIMWVYAKDITNIVTDDLIAQNESKAWAWYDKNKT